MLDLQEKDKQMICELVQQVFTSKIEILAYGSRVNGDNHDSSDLDLVVRTKSLNRLEPMELSNFKEKLQKSNIPIFVQVMDWAIIPEHFRDNINRKNVVLFSN